MITVLHLIAGDLNGGAARGAYWLHRGLCELGVNSIIINDGPRRIDDERIISVANTPLKILVLKGMSFLMRMPLLFYRKRNKIIFSTGFDGIDFTRLPAYQEADIVHLHWINGLVPMRVLKKIKKPVVWTLRDMWPLTGGCHYAMECIGYEKGCGKCPQLGSNSHFDLSSYISWYKRRCLPNKLELVGISRWLSEVARRSATFKGRQVHDISNCVDVNEFSPVDKGTARSVLGLPADKKIVAIGAQAIDDFYKGFDAFVDAISDVKRDDIHLVIFGRVRHEILDGISCPYTMFGFLSDSISLKLVYSAADVFVAPSRMDAFGKTLVESMACGTPVVCFDATGPADIVEHMVTGYKAKPFETADLAQGIEMVLAADGVNMPKAARLRAEKMFDIRMVAKKYICLYENLLKC